MYGPTSNTWSYRQARLRVRGREPGPVQGGPISLRTLAALRLAPVGEPCAEEATARGYSSESPSSEDEDDEDDGGDSSDVADSSDERYDPAEALADDSSDLESNEDYDPAEDGDVSWDLVGDEPYGGDDCDLETLDEEYGLSLIHISEPTRPY